MKKLILLLAVLFVWVEFTFAGATIAPANACPTCGMYYGFGGNDGGGIQQGWTTGGMGSSNSGMMPGGSMTAPNFAMGNNQQGQNQPKGTVKSTGELVSALIEELPAGDTKNGLKEYVAAIGYDKYYGDSVGGSNAGISSYFTNRFTDSKNTCVKDAAKSFYSEVARVLEIKSDQPDMCEKEGSPAMSMGGGANGNLMTHDSYYGCFRPDDRAKINSVAGEGQFKKLSPGWVWELAMKHAVLSEQPPHRMG